MSKPVPSAEFITHHPEPDHAVPGLNGGWLYKEKGARGLGRLGVYLLEGPTLVSLLKSSSPQR